MKRTALATVLGALVLGATPASPTTRPASTRRCSGRRSTPAGCSRSRAPRLMPRRDLVWKIVAGYAQRPFSAPVPGIGGVDDGSDAILKYDATLDFDFAFALTRKLTIGLDVAAYRADPDVGYGKRGRYNVDPDRGAAVDRAPVAAPVRRPRPVAVERGRLQQPAHLHGRPARRPGRRQVRADLGQAPVDHPGRGRRGPVRRGPDVPRRLRLRDRAQARDRLPLRPDPRDPAGGQRGRPAAQAHRARGLRPQRGDHEHARPSPRSCSTSGPRPSPAPASSGSWPPGSCSASRTSRSSRCRRRPRSAPAAPPTAAAARSSPTPTTSPAAATAISPATRPPA